MNGSLFSITRYMNRVCFKVSGGTSVPKLPLSYPPNLVSSRLVRIFTNHYMSRVMRKPDFAIAKTKVQINCAIFALHS